MVKTFLVFIKADNSSPCSQKYDNTRPFFERDDVYISIS